MYRISFVLLLILLQPSWASVDKLPASHAAHVKQVEADKARPYTEPSWAGREGTINYALKQANGAIVSLDCVHVAAIYKIPKPYFVITEWWDNRPDHTIIVNQAAPTTFRPGQTIDISGTINALSDGRRVIEYPRVLGYTSKEGTLLVQGGPCIKGIIEPVQWAYKSQLINTIRPKSYSPTSTKTGIRATTVSATSIDSSPFPIKGLVSYDSIKALLDAKPVEGAWIRLRHLELHLASTDTKYGHYLVLTDKGGQFLQVFTTDTPKTAMARIGRLIGKVHILDGNIVILVDTGPTFDPQLGTGNITIID